MSDNGHGPRQARSEAAHGAGVKSPKVTEEMVRTGTRPAVKRSLNEASHKLGYCAPPASSAEEEKSEAVRRRFEALADPDRDVIADAGRAVLALGALGVVYGDIGTSPLYTEQVIFTAHRTTAQTTPAGVYGVVSLIFWALMIVVSIKYAGFIMRAHNRGDGGIMALTALLQRNKVAYRAALVTLGIFGAALFFGDGIITPSISVLGSLQGLKVAAPGLAHLIVPLSVVILVALFFLQRRGSGTIGWLFGPVILVWFFAIGLLGLSQVVKDPAVLQGLSPTWGVRFLVDNGDGRISGTRRRRARRDRRRGALRRPGPFWRRPDPAWLVCIGPPRLDAQLLGPGRAHPPRPEHRE